MHYVIAILPGSHYFHYGQHGGQQCHHYHPNQYEIKIHVCNDVSWGNGNFFLYLLYPQRIPAYLDQHQLAVNTTTCEDDQQMQTHELVISCNDIHRYPHLNHKPIIDENIQPEISQATVNKYL